MLTVKQINAKLEEDYSLKMIAQAYTEISVVKLQNIRKGIEKNRDFFEEIAKVFHAVKFSAAQKHVKDSGTRRNTISILLTSNHRFYGSLENELIKFYLTETSKTLTDRLVVGKTGLDFLKGMNYFHPYESFVFWEDTPNNPELKGLSERISKYQKILVYYAKFQSVLVQQPVAVDITQSVSDTQSKLSGSKDPENKDHFDYIFEPEINTMVEFFENHIATLLLEQTFLEAELARTAARLISMDRAQANADQLIKDQRKALFQAQKADENMRLLETISSLLKVNGHLSYGRRADYE